MHWLVPRLQSVCITTACVRRDGPHPGDSQPPGPSTTKNFNIDNSCSPQTLHPLPDNPFPPPRSELTPLHQGRSGAQITRPPASQIQMVGLRSSNHEPPKLYRRDSRRLIIQSAGPPVSTMGFPPPKFNRLASEAQTASPRSSKDHGTGGFRFVWQKVKPRLLPSRDTRSYPHDTWPRPLPSRDTRSHPHDTWQPPPES